MATEVTTDLYVRLGIDRSLDEAGIKKHLNKLRSQNAKRRQNPPSKEKAAALAEESKLINEALQTLCNKEVRAQYDEALQAAYDSGKLYSKQEKAYADILEQALEYYDNNKYAEAISLAEKLVEGQTNDVRAYDLLSRCYAETGKYAPAIQVLDKATSIFGDTPDLCQLGARISTNAGEFDSAQQWVNRLMQVAEGSSLAQAEQIYLHLMKSDENLAFQEIDQYISEHPEDGVFKQQMAYALVGHQYAYYKEDTTNNTIYLDTKEGYDKCVMVCEKAVSLYQDEYTTKSLEDAKSFGEKFHDSWNDAPIKSLFANAGMLTLIGLLFPPTIIIAIPFAILGGILAYYSNRPKWQIYRTYYTGELGKQEKIAHDIGVWMYYHTDGLWKDVLRWIVQAILAILKFVVWLATGGPFR